MKGARTEGPGSFSFVLVRSSGSGGAGQLSQLFIGEPQAHGTLLCFIRGREIVVPCGVICVALGSVGKGLPVEIASAGEVHQVIAIGGLDDGGVTDLAACVKAPVVELGDHLAGHDVFIQAALVAVGIGGEFLGQFASAAKSSSV